MDSHSNASTSQYGKPGPTPVVTIGQPTPKHVHDSLPMTGFDILGFVVLGIVMIASGIGVLKSPWVKPKQENDADA